MQEIIGFEAGTPQFELFTVYLLHELKVPGAFFGDPLPYTRLIRSLVNEESRSTRSERVGEAGIRSPRSPFPSLYAIRVGKG